MCGISPRRPTITIAMGKCHVFTIQRTWELTIAILFLATCHKIIKLLIHLLIPIHLLISTNTSLLKCLEKHKTIPLGRAIPKIHHSKCQQEKTNKQNCSARFTGQHLFHIYRGMLEHLMDLWNWFINMKGELRSYVPEYIQDQMINLQLTISTRSSQFESFANRPIKRLTRSSMSTFVYLLVGHLWTRNRGRDRSPLRQPLCTVLIAT